jgi:hypothetical protein
LPESILQENAKLKRDQLDLKGKSGAVRDVFLWDGSDLQIAKH